MSAIERSTSHAGLDTPHWFAEKGGKPRHNSSRTVESPGRRVQCKTTPRKTRRPASLSPQAVTPSWPSRRGNSPVNDAWPNAAHTAETPAGSYFFAPLGAWSRPPVSKRQLDVCRVGLLDHLPNRPLFFTIFQNHVQLLTGSFVCAIM